MTLAELLAVAGLCLPASLRALEPLMAAVPLLAQRRGVSVDAVYAMQAGEAFGAIADEFADWISDAEISAASAAVKDAEAAIDPARMRERMMRRLSSDQS